MPLDISRVQAICFDVDGTLRDTDDQYLVLFARWLKLVRFLLPARDELRAARRLVMFLETPLNVVYNIPDQLHIDDDWGRFKEWLLRAGLRNSRPQAFLVVSGVLEMLASLASQFPLAVVSARDRRGTLAFLNHANITHYFTCIATGQTTRYTKPKPDPVRWAARQMGVSPANCLMVGDTIMDILSGKAAGAQTVGVLCGFGGQAELERAGADLILSTTADLAAFLLHKST